MAKAWLMRTLVLASLALTGAALSGCNADDLANNGATPGGLAPGVQVDPGTPDNPSLPPSSPVDSNTITIAAKYVVLQPDASTAASPTKDEVTTLIANISQVWSQCDIRFVLDDYETHVASADGLLYNPANQSDLDEMRTKYDDGQHALYVKTGTWNRSGDLGADGSNGFSTMPPAAPEGTVFEESVDLNTLLLAHETGHFLGGLEHTTDSTNLMDHLVSPSSTTLTTSQCNDTRTAIKQYHQAWTR